MDVLAFNDLIKSQKKEIDRSLKETEWRTRQKMKEEEELETVDKQKISSTVKARIVGGCLIITLPSEIRKGAGIEPDDRIFLELDREKVGEIRISKVQGESLND